MTTETGPNNSAADSHQGIWVFAEQRDGKLANVAFELLARARELADSMKTDLSAVCLGHDIDTSALVAHGADTVYVVNDESFAAPLEDPYAAELARLIERYRPEIVLAGATSFGKAFLPKVAAALKAGLIADCTALDLDAENGRLLQTHSAFGGSLMSTAVCLTLPRMATVLPRVFKPRPVDPAREGQIIKIDFDKAAVTSGTKLLNFVADLGKTVKIEEADIIVSGGRGLEKAENFSLIEELAGALGAAVGSSRPPVEEGWIPYAHQVGQSGRAVRPKLYIACGISGQVQHLAGISEAECIVAINSDPTAPIFETATYGIVGDLFKIVPLLTQKLKNPS